METMPPFLMGVNGIKKSPSDHLAFVGLGIFWRQSETPEEIRSREGRKVKIIFPDRD